MKRREYHEIYGFLPDDIINKISEVDHCRLFVEYVLRKPTSTGWFIARTVVAALGDKFIDYMLQGIIESLQEDDIPITKDVLVDNLATMMERFASDSNSMAEYVRIYREEVLGISDDDFSEEEENSRKPKRDAKGRFVKAE